MLKHFFLVYEKHNMIFSFETLGRMHKNIFSFLIFFVFLEVLMKTGYFNTGFVFFKMKKKTKIKQNNVKQYTQGNHKY
jgi:hypothetical protein